AYTPGGNEPLDEEDPNRGPQRESIYFNMNYYRPHFFGLEAVEEVDALVEAFDLTVSDPQAEGMGEGEYTSEGFLRGWNAGNGFAHQAFAQIQSEGEQTVNRSLTLPSATLRACWEWTRGRNELAEDLFEGDEIDAFVPRVMFLQEGGQAVSMCVWP